MNVAPPAPSVVRLRGGAAAGTDDLATPLLRCGTAHNTHASAFLPRLCSRWQRRLFSLCTRLRAPSHRRCRRAVLVVACLVVMAATVLILVVLCLYSTAHPLGWIRDAMHRTPTEQPREVFLEDEKNGGTLPALRAAFSEYPDNAFCAVCADGQVVFRPAKADTREISEPFSASEDTVATHVREFTVCDESIEEERRPASSSATLHSVHDCAARLYNLGLLSHRRDIEVRTSNTGSFDKNNINNSGMITSCAVVRAPVQVISGNKTLDHVSCSVWLAYMQQSTTPSTTLLELSFPRLTVWPFSVDASSSYSNGTKKKSSAMKAAACAHASPASSSCQRLSRLPPPPPYVNTTPASDTDIDRDESAPSGIYMSDDLRDIILTFSSTGATEWTPSFPHREAAPPSSSSPLHCPTHFLTVKLGQFGRHHNQLQEILNGLALARRLNRTLLLPPFVPALYAAYLQLNAEIPYGWNALRRLGRYCLVTYAEARPLLQRIGAQDSRHGVVSMQRVHFAIGRDLERRWHTMPPETQEAAAWGVLPRVPVAEQRSTALYDADEWFACGVRNVRYDLDLLRPPPGEASVLHFTENLVPPSLFTQEDLPGSLFGPRFTLTRSVPAGHERRYWNGTRWEGYRLAARTLLEKFGIKNAAAASSSAPRLLVLSSLTAFHLRPNLTEMTRLLGLLRPSPFITSEVGRFYRLWATHYQWPPYTREEHRTFDDCLQPYRFKRVIGLHVRRREHTCRAEAELPSNTLLSVTQGRYVLDGTGHSAAEERQRHRAGASFSTVARLANDCDWDVRATLHLYHQYATWLSSHQAKEPQQQQQHQRQQAPRARYTSFVAYDEQAGPIAQEMERVLQRTYRPTRQELLADGTKPSFIAVYDRRPRVDLYLTYVRASRLIHATQTTPTDATSRGTAAAREPASRQLDRMLEVLYPAAEEELMAMTYDFFLLTNTEVFRGNMISSVSINVCVRRWGRGLPCHGVMVGYYETLYKGFL